MAASVFFLLRGSFLREGFFRRHGFFPLLAPSGAAASFFERGFSLSLSPFIFTRIWFIPTVFSGTHAHVDDSSVGRGRDFNGCLVRFHLKQGLFERNPVSGRNENLYHLPGFDSFSKFWEV